MVKDLIHNKMAQNSFGCNTDGLQTSEKNVGAIYETNEMGS